MGKWEVEVKGKGRGMESKWEVDENGERGEGEEDGRE